VYYYYPYFISYPVMAEMRNVRDNSKPQPPRMPVSPAPRQIPNTPVNPDSPQIPTMTLNPQYGRDGKIINAQSMMRDLLDKAALSGRITVYVRT
jgi:hypothetical protein